MHLFHEFKGAGEAKIRYFGISATIQDDVCRFYVLVDDTVGMAVSSPHAI